MPTVLRVGGFAFGFYSREHLPAHVHCSNADGTVVVEIGPATARNRYGNIRIRDVHRAEAIVAEHRELLQAAWDEFAIKRGGGR